MRVRVPLCRRCFARCGSAILQGLIGSLSEPAERTRNFSLMVVGGVIGLPKWVPAQRK
jgi:hypothetical protein